MIWSHVTAGIHAAIAHPGGPVKWPAATALAGGVALFLAGIGSFRRCMSIGPPSTRIVAVLASIPIGAMASARLHLVSVLGVVVVMLLVSVRRAAAAATV